MTKTYKTPPKPGTRRYLIADIANHPDKKYALFLRSKSGGNAHFSCLIGDEQEAINVARQFASDVVSRGEIDFTYYVVELKHRVGIEHGKPVDKAMA